MVGAGIHQVHEIYYRFFQFETNQQNDSGVSLSLELRLAKRKKTQAFNFSAFPVMQLINKDTFQI